MKKITLFLGLFCFLIASAAFPQNNPGKLKGSGEVFFYEPFDWENPDDPRGWTQPDGYYMEDPTDTGFNWHWWPNEGLDALYVKEPPFQSTSKSDGHLCLFAGLYNNYLTGPEGTPIDNSIVFPTFDCSDKGSVVLSFETSFMQYSPLSDGMQVMVSNDAGVHWASLDCDFGAAHKGRPDDVPPGVPALFQANISDVAAGMSEVIIKIWWHGTSLYYWLIDDFKLQEAWDNDLQLQHFYVEWDDEDEDTAETFTASWPLSQLKGSMMNFEASVLNFGEFDQERTYLEVDVSRNSQPFWNAKSEMLDSWVGLVDTFKIDQAFTPPAEYGHYKIKYEFVADQEEQTPEDTYREFFMDVTDSVYSRADNTPELDWSYSFERYVDTTDDGMMLDHFVGVKYPIYSDCEANSISVFITGGLADGQIEFGMSLYYVPPAEEEADPFELLTSQIVALDSSMFNTWVTLPLEKDGESEFLYAGDLVYAGITYWNYHTDMITNRNMGLGKATDKSVPINDPVSIAKSTDDWNTGEYVSKRNLLVRLNINDHNNIIDNVNYLEKAAKLDQNYPNPMVNQTEIKYSLTSQENVSFEFRDITGKLVASFDEGVRNAGDHSLKVDSKIFESGLYFYTMKAGSFNETKRMIVN